MNAVRAYLDYNATAPVKPDVARGVMEALGCVGNPSSVHRDGRLAHRRMQDARAQVAGLVGADPSWVVFTSGGTESNAIALTGTDRQRLIVSATEHESVLSVARNANSACGVVPVNCDGVMDLAALDNLLTASPEPALVSVMLANNETGVMQPVSDVAKIARTHGALMHCDAVQAVGKTEVDFTALGVHLMSVSAHKLGGTQGVGALLVHPDAGLEGGRRGGGQELGRRPGTENIPGIVGFGIAAELAALDIRRGDEIAAMRDRVEARLKAAARGIRVFGDNVERLPNTSCFAMPGVSSETQVMSLDLAGVAVSAGAACSSGKVGPSHVLRAMGASEADSASAIRVSLGWASKDDDVDRLVKAWMELYSRVGTGDTASETAA